MKKLMSLAAAALLLAACNNEVENQPVNNQKVPVRFSAGITTRAVDAAWTAGDKIGIYMMQAGTSTVSENADNIAYTTTGTSDFTPVDGTKTIYFPIDGTVDFWAYYPYQAGITGLKYAVDVATQTNQEAIDLLYAQKVTGKTKAAPAVAFTFRHQLAKVILNVVPGTGLTQDDLANLTVTVKRQNTTAKFDLADGTLANQAAVADVLMKTTEAGKKYEAILLPETVTDRTLEFNLNNGQDAAFKWTMSLALVAGTKYTYTVTINRTAINVTGTITDWNNGGSGEAVAE